jgi:hypothetical protein
MSAAQAGASRGGLKGCWQALIPFALDAVRNGEIDALNVAAVYTHAGDADKALLWLQKAIETRSFGITFIGVDPTFDPVIRQNEIRVSVHLSRTDRTSV